MKRRRRYRKSDHIPATQIAALGFCETKLVLQDQHGDRVTKTQAAARVEGQVAHEAFDKAVVAKHNQGSTVARDRRCFVATAIYGVNDPRTEDLRRFRDTRLMTTSTGRALARIYYTASPLLVRVMRLCPILKYPVRHLLDWVRKHTTIKDQS